MAKKIWNNSATTPLKKVILCPPTYHEFQPINVITEKWLEEGLKSDHSKAMAEHAELVKAYEDNGVEVILMDPDPDLAYEVYARDFGASIAEGVIMGAFREPIRKGESAAYEAKLKEIGVPVVARTTAGAFEGGDFWFLDEYTIAHGVIARTDWDGYNSVARQMQELGYTTVGVECERENLHLDMCFNIVGEKIAVVCKEALPKWFVRMLEKRGFTLIDVPQEGVFRHHCNLQNIGNNKVISFKNNVDVNKQMRALGLEVIEINLDEILKGGGGPHCMTFPLERG
ncbi:N-dimethylarginine dimethylaminohydrolase [Enterococcus sp. PF1-24]|uniref:dimethylarginine dimethylaminohydrolase family protein n=1 Tax=unclassified Enterococcus TaxID=2608891 RepID=UPI002473FAA7|nr:MULTISPECIES: arginine deiminase family protein [unclassified Enterococcus]MDH6365353.1 N-dimethylarginine dimethylaminohydrolase [Enterococcus sp. PFB1-1]MDH6402454.1 N-dimethylarginine dimethylaminohydrolase [Enterococcus sp. PF1-24]